jgi:hypothetical protein
MSAPVDDDAVPAPVEDDEDAPPAVLLLLLLLLLLLDTTGILHTFEVHVNPSTQSLAMEQEEPSKPWH